MIFLRNCKCLAKFVSSGYSATNIINKLSKCEFSTGKFNLSNSQKSMENSTNFESLQIPVKSPSDKKEYRVIKLENGLTACLISDPVPESTATEEVEEDVSSSSSDESHGSVSVSGKSSAEETDDSGEDGFPFKGGAVEQKMAAAGLCVGVGSFSDPRDVPGMAHFLEHMVFMGSKKFPAENDFDSFIKKGGGSNNASTDMESTCFYFECLEKHLLTALDKFAQFFIAPLMKKGAMTREREAIESEFQMALPSDSLRKEQLLFSLAKPESPVNSFSWGNLITLRDNVSDDKLYEGVHNFRKRHYSAHRMTLAIQARLPLDTLQTFVLECFSKVPNNKLPPEDFRPYNGQVFNTPEFSKMYYVKPTKDMCQVDLKWSLPSLLDEYKCGPLRYLSHLLGDEGIGSLSSYLRKKLWAIAISSGSGDSESEHNSIYAVFSIDIVLTDEGLRHLNEVIEAVFSYLNLLKQIGPQERIYNELKTIADNGFKFAREESAEDSVEEMAESMQIYPPEDYLTANEIFFEYKPDVIKSATDHLRADRMNIMVMTNDLPDGLSYNQKEKWFGTEYTEVAIPEHWIQTWDKVAPYPDLSIPPINPYLTEDFTILPEVPDNSEYPQNVLSTPLLEMWYRQDQKFKLPVAYYYFYFISLMPLESAENSAMLDMMMNLLTFALAEELYPATCADLYPSILTQEKGLILKVYGYNEKLPLLISIVTQYLLNLNDHLTEDMFKAIKDKLLKNYYNKLLKPSTLAKNARLQLLVDNYWTPIEKYTALRNCTFNDIKEFSKNYTKSLYVKALVEGNVSKEVAMNAVNKLVKDLNCSQLPQGSYPEFRVVQVPAGEKCLRVAGFNKKDTNSIITNYYQASPFDMRTSAIIETIMEMIEEPLFDILRTKEQLGYHVYCSLRDTFSVLGYTITVNTQATKFTTQYVNDRIEEFVKSSRQLLKEMTEKDFAQIKEDLIKTKECVDVDLKEEVDRNWSEIINDDYMFDRLKKEIEAIKGLSLKEIRAWWDRHNRFGSQNDFRKISIQVVGHNVEAKESSDSDDKGSGDKDKFPSALSIEMLGNDDTEQAATKGKEYFIKDIKNFKQNAYLYPSFKNTKCPCNK